MEGTAITFFVRYCWQPIKDYKWSLLRVRSKSFPHDLQVDTDFENQLLDEECFENLGFIVLSSKNSASTSSSTWKSPKFLRCLFARESVRVPARVSHEYPQSN